MSSNRNKECTTIRDILPSYVDGLTSDVSNKLIEEHIEGCEECRAELERMRKEREGDVEKIRKEEKAYLRHINAKRRRPYIYAAVITVLALALMYLFVPGILGDKRLSKEREDALMKQYAAREELYYGDYLPAELFATCHIYGVQQSGDEMTAYVYASEGEYVKLGGKAYSMSGSSFPCAIHVKAGDEEMNILKVDVPLDGMYYMDSIRKMFPLRYYIRMQTTSEAVVSNSLGKGLARKVNETWGVEVSDDLLEIDEEKGTYTITRVDDGTDEHGEYYFNTEIIEEGKL